MTPERWQQVKDVLATALELPPGERSAYLDRSCASDHSLRGEVNRLLHDEQQVDPQFLGNTAMGLLAAAVLPEERNPWIGRLIGAYRIVQQIGTGGMGEVYRSVREDDEYRKPVALKIIRGGQDSGFVVSRFRRPAYYRLLRPASASNNGEVAPVFPGMRGRPRCTPAPDYPSRH
jgi:hypothetical protein